MQQSVRNTPAPQPRCTVKCTFTLAPSLISSIKAKIRGEEPPTELPADYALSSEETPQDRLRSKFGDEGLGSQVGFFTLWITPGIRFDPLDRSDRSDRIEFFEFFELRFRFARKHDESARRVS